MFTSQRPKLDIPKTTSEWIWDMIGYTLFIASILLLVIVWRHLPSEVPAHYNAAGEVDRWGSKWELIMLPAINLCLLLFLTFFEKHPEMHNYPKRFNENNALAFYTMSRQLLNQVKNICIIVFTILTVETISIALDWGITIGRYLLPIVLILIFTPIIIVFFKQKRIR